MRVTQDTPSAMLDPSIASLTTAITQRADACAEEIRTVFVYNKAPEGRNVSQASSVLAAVAEFTYAVSQLREAAADNLVSDSARTAAIEALSSCNQASAGVFKQFMGMQDDAASQPSRPFDDSLLLFLDAYTRLFTSYTTIISHNEPHIQDQQLNSTATSNLVAQVIYAADQASAPDVTMTAEPEEYSPATLPIREREPPVAAQPPPYTEDNSVKVTISTGGAPRGAKKEQPVAGGWDKFMAPFKSIEKAMRAKPSPFVTALCAAVARGDANNVAAIISQGADVNGRSEDGDSPLSLAIEHNYPRIANMLLAAGASIHTKGSKKMPALFQASSLGSLELADLLMQHGARADATDITGKPYVINVVASGNINGVQYLLDRGAKATAKDITGEAAIVKAVKQQNLEMTSLLLKYGAKIGSKDITGQPLMAIAAQKNNLDMAKFLLEHGADPNAKDLTGQPLVALALAKKNPEMMRFFLEHGANPNAKDITGASLLGVAGSQYGHSPELVDILLRHGANANSKTVIGTTVFSQAVTSRHMDLARHLLEYGANPNATEVTGQPIIITVITDRALDQKAKVEMVTLMLDHGLRPGKAKDFVTGERACVIARKAGNTEIADLLEGRSWD